MQSYKNAIDDILNRLHNTIPGHDTKGVNAYIVGGVACYLLTKLRASDDIDLIFTHKIINSTEDIFVPYVDEDNNLHQLSFDQTYNETLGLLHENYRQRAINFRKYAKFNVYILSPVDLIITKLSRFNAKDQDDIKALIERCNVDKTQLKELAQETIDISFGHRIQTLKTHLDIILNFFE